MVDGATRTGSLLKVVIMRDAKLRMPSWKTGVLKRIYAVPTEVIRDVLLLVFVLIGLLILVVSPILLSLLMPTGS
jgi:hypothetical protein